MQLKLAVNANQVNPELSVYPFEYMAVLKYKTHLHVLKRENSRRLSGYTQKGHTCILYLGAACKELISSYRNLGPSN